ncbi:MAG: heme-binding protein [Flavobacterium sp.]|uniref:heme-binding protein n=1 Tax=Flavobacterium sp. TaxID=239 RepID=UPI002735DC6F|nr:heme-binding protein [Flavobacterium sp.]MDP3679944.1 heme-binding protein [Flavobacterium sp.]MDZ4329724.1 heme-binding protein [Flavobacterium sp.]
MKINSYLLVLLIPLFSSAQISTEKSTVFNNLNAKTEQNYTTQTIQLTLKTAFQITQQARTAATALGKNVSIAILDGSGQIIIITRDEEVGPHNTEAARRKAYTALSTKTPTLLLSKNARLNPDTQNLATLPELLLLAGGYPLWYNGKIIGGIGVAGGGSPENDDLIAKSGAIIDAQITTH